MILANIKKILASIFIASLVFAYSPPPAHAGTKSGTISCATNSRTVVRGEQQRRDILTLKLAGSVVYQSPRAYVAYGHLNFGGTMSWSAHSEWLLWSGSYATCAPRDIE